MNGLAPPRRYVAIAAVSLGTALVVIDGGIATIALPTIARDLGVPGSATVLVVTIYQLVLVMALLPLSNLGDRVGHRRLYQAGQILFTLATILCFVADNLLFLLAVRAFQGLGAACVLSVSSAMIRTIYPDRQLGRGLGINTIVVSSSIALAPTLGGLVLAVAPWPWVFAVAAPFGLASLALGRALPDPEPRDRPFDLPGAVLSAAFFGTLVIGIETIVHRAAAGLSLLIIVAGLGIGTLFVRRSLRTPDPILPVDLLGRRIIALSVFGAFVAFMGSITLMLTLPFRFQESYGFAPAEIGAIMAAWPLAMLCTAPIAGSLSDRFPAGLLGGIGMTLAATGLIVMAFLPEAPTYFDATWRLALCGAGYGMFLSPNSRLIVGSTPVARAAAAGGLIATNRLMAQTLGTTLVAVVLSLGWGSGRVPALLAAAMAVIAGFCSVARLNPLIREPAALEVDDL